MLAAACAEAACMLCLLVVVEVEGVLVAERGVSLPVIGPLVLLVDELVRLMPGVARPGVVAGVPVATPLSRAECAALAAATSEDRAGCGGVSCSSTKSLLLRVFGAAACCEAVEVLATTDDGRELLGVESVEVRAEGVAAVGFKSPVLLGAGVREGTGGGGISPSFS